MINVSVLISCYNKENYLEECISSVLRQSKQPKEIIVVHDGCDNPMHHAKVTSIFSKENYGVAHARDEAFRFSTGELILFVDADDVLSPDYLEKMVLVLAKGNDIIYPDLFLWMEGESKLVVTPKKIDVKFVKTFNRVVIPVTCLMKREVYKTLGGFKKMEVLEDLDFWIRAIKENYTFAKAQTLLWYRRYNGTRNSLDLDKRKLVLNEIMKQL